MLVIISGNVGSGKTLLMTIFALSSQTAHIVSNYKLHPRVDMNKTVSAFDMLPFVKCEYESCLILLDEAYTYLESRTSGAEQNRLMSYVLFQSRKKDVDMYLTVQLKSTIDVRFRELADIYIECQTRNPKSREDFVYCLHKGPKSKVIRIKFADALPFMQLYDTYEVVTSDTAHDDSTYSQFMTEADRVKMVTALSTEIRAGFNALSADNTAKKVPTAYIRKIFFEKKIPAKFYHAVLFDVNKTIKKAPTKKKTSKK